MTALTPKSVMFSLVSGLDEAANKEADAAGLRELTNWDHVEGGAIQRRNGFTLVDSFTQQGTRGLVASDKSIATVQASSYRTFPSSTSVSSITTAAYGSGRHRTVLTAWDGKRVRMGDIAVLTYGGRSYAMIASLVYDEAFNTAWGSSNATTILLRLVDYETGQTLYSTSVAGSSPRVVVDGSGDKFLFFYLAPGYATPVALKFRAITVSTLSSSADTTIDASAISAAGRHAIDAFTWDGNGQTYVVYTKSAINLGLARVTAAGGVTASLNDAASLANGQSVAITVNDNSLVTVAYVGTATHAHASVYDTSLAARLRGTEGGTPVVSGTALSLRSVGVVKVTGSNLVWFVAESFIANDVRTATYDASVGTIVAKTAIPKALLVSKPFEVGGSSSGNFLAVAVTPSNALVSGYRNVLLARLGETTGVAVVGQLAFDECGVVDHGSGLTDVAPVPYGSTSPRKLALVVPVTEEGVDAVASAPQVCKLRVTEIDFGTGVLVTTRNRGLGYVAGSVPRVWDGSALVPAAFSAAPQSPTGGSGGASLWAYCLVLEYADRRGNIQTSPPSVVNAASSFPAAGTSSVVLTYGVVPNDVTVRAKLYRTAANGSTFTLVRQWIVPAGTTTETVSDALTDSQISSAEALYTTGNALESELNPPLNHLCSHKNRLFGVRADDPRTIAFTQETTDPFFPRWSAVLTLRVDNEGGDPTAVASMDDKLLVFQENQIVAVCGEGPDGVGAGTFGLPEVVARGVGVDSNNRASVVTVPDGVMFRHSTGIYLLTRQLALIPIGQPVRRTLGTTTVTRARFLPSRHQVWFMLAGGASMLVFDTQFGRWSTYTGPWRVPYDAAEVDGTVYLLDADGQDNVNSARLFKLDTASYVDYNDGVPGVTPIYVTQTIKMPWFRAERSLAQRMWQVGFSGEVVNGTGISVTVDAYSQRPQTNAAKNVETRDARFTWTAGQIAALPAGGFERWAKVVTQRCNAFRCEITFTPTNTDSVGLKLTHAGYKFGVLPTRGKAPTATKPAAS